MSRDKAMTYAQLKRHLDRLPPEQLAREVQWAGDERGGKVYGVIILKEDMCNPSGELWEPKSEVIQQRIHEGESQADAEALAEDEIVAHAGQVLIWVDGPVCDLAPNEDEIALPGMSVIP